MAATGGQGVGPKRNRIVINLEEPRKETNRRGQGGGRRRTLSIVLLLLCVILVALLAGGYFWWQSYKTGPAYSLALMVDAVQRNDMAAFDQFVDTDKIVDNFVPQVTDKASAQYGSLLGQTARRQMESVLSKALPQVKPRVRDEVAKEVKELSERAQGVPFAFVVLGMPWVVGINQQGDVARAAVNLKNRPVALTMQRNGERWKVVAVKDDMLTNRIIENIAQDLPPPSAPPAPDVRKQLRRNLPEGLPKIPLLEGEQK